MSGSHPSPELLDAFLLDELDDPSHREIEAHLRSCSTCREQAEQLQAALGAYRHAELEAADERGLQRLLAARGDRRLPRWRWPQFAAAAVAALIIFMGGFWTGRGGSVARADEPPRITAAPPRVHSRPDHEPPAVTFAVAEADRIHGLASPDSTWN